MTDRLIRLAIATSALLVLTMRTALGIECPLGGAQEYLIRFKDPTPAWLHSAKERILGLPQTPPGQEVELPLVGRESKYAEEEARFIAALDAIGPAGITVERRYALLDVSSSAHPLSAPEIASQWHYDAVRAAAAWNNVKRWSLPEDAAASPVVAVLDSGIDVQHCALRARIWPNSQPPGVPSPCAQLPSLSLAVASPGNHGTHVAGIIIGDSGDGVLRPLAPNAQVVDLKIAQEFGNGHLCIDSRKATEAITRAAALKAAVANLSWNASFNKDMQTELKNAKDVLFVVAADGGRPYIDTQASYPIWYDFPNIISVTTSGPDRMTPDHEGARIDIAAPGYGIMSTLPNNSQGPDSGTSMAAPMVSATAVLVKSLAPHWTPLQIKRYLIDSADRSGEWTDKGIGRLDAARATAAPVTVSWPADDACVNTFTRDEQTQPMLRVKWQQTFVSSSCSKLDIAVAINGNGYQSRLTDVDVVLNQAEFSVPRNLSGNGRLQLRCSGTQLVVESAPFRFGAFP